MNDAYAYQWWLLAGPTTKDGETGFWSRRLRRWVPRAEATRYSDSQRKIISRVPEGATGWIPEVVA